MMKYAEMTIKDIKDLVIQLRNTLNPQTCRGLVDCFLIRKQKDEVRWFDYIGGFSWGCGGG